jgi:multiple sugar transport system permease protein
MTTVAPRPVVTAPQQPVQPPAPNARKMEARAGWAFSLPFLILYSLFLIGPTLYGLLMSFFNTTTVQGGLGDFVGFSNYREAFSSPDFWSSMWHTILFTLVSTPFLVILALAFAIMTERVRRGKWFYRLVFFAPYVVPSASVVLIFTWLYAPQIGLINKAFTLVGLDAPNWSGTQAWAMASVVLLTIWWTVGFNFVLYLAGLQDIPADLFEAAAVDGASGWQQIRSITLPLLRRTTALVIILQLLASLRVFDQIYLLLAGGPNYSTRPVIEYIYDVGFTDFRAGYAAAATMIYFVVLLVVSVGWFLLNRHRAAADRDEQLPDESDAIPTSLTEA